MRPTYVRVESASRETFTSVIVFVELNRTNNQIITAIAWKCSAKSYLNVFLIMYSQALICHLFPQYQGHIHNRWFQVSFKNTKVIYWSDNFAIERLRNELQSSIICEFHFSFIISSLCIAFYSRKSHCCGGKENSKVWISHYFRLQIIGLSDQSYSQCTGMVGEEYGSWWTLHIGSTSKFSQGRFENTNWKEHTFIWNS